MLVGRPPLIEANSPENGRQRMRTRIRTIFWLCYAMLAIAKVYSPSGTAFRNVSISHKAFLSGILLGT